MQSVKCKVSPSARLKKILFGFTGFLLLGLFFLALPRSALAANIIWTNGTGDGKWSTCVATGNTNWSGGTNGACPGTSDVATFNSTNTTNVTIDTAVNVKGINIVGTSGGVYSGTLTQNSGVTIAVGASGFVMNTGTTATFSGGNSAFTITGGSFTMNGGTFTGGSGAMSIVNGSFTQGGGTFTNTSGGFDIERDFTITGGTFINTGKTITFSDTNLSDDTTITYAGGTVGGTVVITKDNTGDFSVASNTTIDVGSGATTAFSANGTYTNNGTIKASGAWVINCSTGTFTNNGTITHTGTDWDMNDCNFTNSLGATINYSGTTFDIDRNFTQNGTFDSTGKTITFGGTVLADATTLTLGSGINIQGNVVINKSSSSAFALGSNVIVLGDFTRTDGAINNTAYTLTVQGNFSTTTTDAFGGTSLTVVMGGSGTQTVTQNTSGADIDSVFQINKSGGTASLSGSNTFTVTGAACSVVEGVFNLGGLNFACSTGFTVEDGGTLQLYGSETTTPILNSGSTVKYTGDGDGNVDAYTLKDLDYHHLTIASTDSGDTYATPNSTEDANGNFTVSGGAFTAPSSNFTIGGNFAHSGGTFTHNSGTIVLDGTSQQITGSSTFNNLTKSVTSVDTLTFGASDTQTVSGTLTLNGASGQRLSLRSSTTGTQWKVDPQGTRTLSYLDVKDSNNIGSNIDAAALTNVVDSGNNTGWTWNQNPSDPSSLGSASMVNGSWATDSTPTLSFTLADSDNSDTVKYQIQIDDSSDFSSAVIDYTSALSSQGSFSFTVGQAAGSGSYTTGSVSTTLSDGSYYWRVKAIDNSAASSSYSTANSGSVAFKVDATAPLSFDLDSPGADSYINNERPTFKWKATTDATSGLSSYSLEIDNGDTGDFTISGIPTSGTTDYSTNKYLVHFDGEFISIYTKSSSDWGNSENDGKLKEGSRSWTIKAIDAAGNIREQGRTVIVDLTSPTLSSLSVSDSLGSKDNYLITTNQLPSVTGIIADTYYPDKVEISVYKENYFLGVLTSTELATTRSQSLSNTSSTSLSFSVSVSQTLDYGSYYVDISGFDKAGNRSGISTSYFKIMTSQQAQEILKGKISKEDKKTIQEKAQVSLPDLEKKAKLRREKEIDNLAVFLGQIKNSADSLTLKAAETYISLVQNVQFLAETTGDSVGRLAANLSTTLQPAQVKFLEMTAQVAGVVDQVVPDSFEQATFVVFIQPFEGANATLADTEKEIKARIVQNTQSSVSNFQSIAGNIGNGLQTGLASIDTSLESSQERIKKGIADTNRGASEQLKAQSVKLKTAVELAIRSIAKPIDETAGILSRTKVWVLTFESIVFDPNPTVITNVTIEETGKDYAVVSWETNHFALGKVNFGSDLTYGQEVILPKREKYHQARLTSLKPGQRYFFEVMSQNKNYVYDAFYSFETNSE